jgi:sterol desaturase/sphingolipid hydroxylase (fatty acid hydroxylase superfamily)
MALWEVIAPRRALSVSKLRRWLNNIGVVALNTVLLRLIFPAAAVGLAFVAARRGWGVLNQIDLPVWLEIVCAVVVLDFVIYLQHVMFHAVPLFWRLHRMHHADLDFDVTTGARFHPIEILLSMVIKLATVTVLGPAAVAVLIFEILLNATSMFNHSNVRLPRALDRWLRRLIVTPDMHRVHHSILEHETNSNFGFNLPWWDRLFGTYQAQPDAGHERMVIGIHGFRNEQEVDRLAGMLWLPFRGKVRSYSVNRRQAKRSATARRTGRR